MTKIQNDEMIKGQRTNKKINTKIFSLAKRKIVQNKSFSNIFYENENIFNISPNLFGFRLHIEIYSSCGIPDSVFNFRKCI